MALRVKRGIYLIRNNAVCIICHVFAGKAEGVCSEGREGKKPPFSLVAPPPHISLTDSGAITIDSILDPVP